MRKAALIVGLLFWVATSIAVLAQEKKNNLVQLPILLDCGPIDEIAKILVEYQEVPLAQADVIWRVPNGDFLEGEMTIFVHPDSFTISIVVQVTEDFGCMAFPGNNFRPFYEQGTKT